MGPVLWQPVYLYIWTRCSALSHSSWACFLWGCASLGRTCIGLATKQSQQTTYPPIQDPWSGAPLVRPGPGNLWHVLNAGPFNPDIAKPSSAATQVPIPAKPTSQVRVLVRVENHYPGPDPSPTLPETCWVCPTRYNPYRQRPQRLCGMFARFGPKNQLKY